MSSGIAYLRQRDSLSVLLSQIRKNVPHNRFQALLQLQLAADRWINRRYLPPRREVRWAREMERRIEKGFEALHSGKSLTPTLERVVHLYGHLFY